MSGRIVTRLIGQNHNLGILVFRLVKSHMVVSMEHITHLLGQEGQAVMV